MFGHGYFGAGYFGPGYWGPGTDTPPPTPAVKTGAGGIDPGEGLRRSVKPTGLLHLPKKAKQTQVDVRVDEAAIEAAEIAARLAREFGDETEAAAQAEAVRLVQLTQAEIDQEIGVLLRKKMRTQEDEVMLLLLMTAAAA